ncbi:putative malate dehydrogenase 1B [Mytilus trossulus]|uniref:putative malate dehydrogenase 1B n=1 Tax=Mytilus trossulus TaxID=6551 RepID=UPI0030052444
MAKIVIAGKSECPYYARAELLGDKLARNLPNFQLHKIVQQPDDWEKWLKNTCNERGWQHMKSPIVWRELVDRGGKGVLIGGANEFQEYAFGYYGIQSDQVSNDMNLISKENKQYKVDIVKEEAEFKARSSPIHVCITCATSPVCYAIINSIGQGDVFGKHTEIALHLLDTNDKLEELEGLKMEAEDLAHGLLREVSVTSDTKDAFKNCSAIVLLDDLIQNPEEDKSAWIKRNSSHFSAYAKVINDAALKNVKVLHTGNGPVNMNTYMMIQNAPNIPRQNFVGLSRRIENNAKAVVAERLKVNTSGVVDLIVWGNVNGEHYVDLARSRVHGYDGAIWGPPSFSLPAPEMVWDKPWMDKDYIELVKTRHEKMTENLKHTPSMSAGGAITSMLEHWWNGSPAGQMFSLAVCSEGWYNIPDGIVFSFPVTMVSKGYWNVVQDIELSEEMKTAISATLQDIQSEKDVLFPPPTPPPTESKVTIIDPKDEEQQQEKTEKSESSEGEKQDDSEGEKTDPKLDTIMEEKTGSTTESA